MYNWSNHKYVLFAVMMFNWSNHKYVYFAIMMCNYMFWWLFTFHNTGTCFTRLWLWAGWPTSFSRPTRETMLTKTNTAEKQREDFPPQKRKKNEGEWTRKAESRTWKKFLVVGEACVAICLPTTGLKGNIRQLCVINHRDQRLHLWFNAAGHARREVGWCWGWDGGGGGGGGEGRGGGRGGGSCSIPLNSLFTYCEFSSSHSSPTSHRPLYCGV